MPKPSLQDIRSAIDRSGFVLELRLAPKIEKAGFWVQTDKQFRDQDTGKSREIDLYASCRTDIGSSEVTAGKITYVMPEFFETHLVIECKSLSTPLVFFARENRLPAYGRLMFGGFPSMLWKRERQSAEIVGELFEYHLNLPEFHSYWSARYLATRFGRLTSKKIAGGVIDWEMDHGTIYPAVEKLSKASIAVHRKNLEQARYLEPWETDQFRLHTTHPILVASGDIYECRVSRRGYSLRKAHAVYLDWSLDSEKVSGSTRICVVSERSFGMFMKKVAADRQGIERGLRKLQSRLRRAAAYEKADPGLRKHHSDDV